MIVYKITNLINGKIYVGQTTRTIEERLREHKRSDFPIGKAIRKYGIENFKIDILSTCTSLDELNETEIFWISKLDCLTPNGYNRTEGGATLFKNFIMFSTQTEDRWIIMHRKALADLVKNASPTALRVFLYLSDRQSFDDGLKVSKKYVAEELGLSRTVVWQGFNWLKENNYIKERKVDGLIEFLLNPDVTSCNNNRKRNEKIKLWKETIQDL